LVGEFPFLLPLGRQPVILGSWVAAIGAPSNIHQRSTSFFNVEALKGILEDSCPFWGELDPNLEAATTGGYKNLFGIDSLR